MFLICFLMCDVVRCSAVLCFGMGVTDMVVVLSETAGIVVMVMGMERRAME